MRPSNSKALSITCHTTFISPLLPASLDLRVSKNSSYCCLVPSYMTGTTKANVALIVASHHFTSSRNEMPL